MAELFIEFLTNVLTEILAADILVELTSRTKLIAELKERAKIQQPKELKVFNSLRLSVVVATEVLADILMDVAADVATDVVVATEAVAEAGVRQKEDQVGD